MHKEKLHYLNRNIAHNLSSIRDINYLKIMKLIYEVRSISRADIARRLNISKTTVTSVTLMLIQNKMIFEEGKGIAKRGRRPLLLKFNERFKLALGIEISDDMCIGILTDLYAQPVCDPVFTELVRGINPNSWRGKEALVKTVHKLTQDIDKKDILGISLGVLGILDHRSRSIKIAESLGWADFSVEEFEKLFDIPVRVLNSSNAAVLGEKWYGAGKNKSNLIYLSISEGISAGIIINNKLITGQTGGAGEIGHITIAPQGPLCRCGSFGCFECLASKSALLRRAKDLAKDNRRCSLSRYTETGNKDISLPILLEEAEKGDLICQQLLRQEAEYIGTALAIAINILDPELIIIGGDIGIQLGDYLLPMIHDSVAQKARYFNEVKIILSKLGRLAVPIGSASRLLG